MSVECTNKNRDNRNIIIQLLVSIIFFLLGILVSNHEIYLVLLQKPFVTVVINTLFTIFSIISFWGWGLGELVYIIITKKDEWKIPKMMKNIVAVIFISVSFFLGLQWNTEINKENKVKEINEGEIRIKGELEIIIEGFRNKIVIVDTYGNPVSLDDEGQCIIKKINYIKAEGAEVIWYLPVKIFKCLMAKDKEYYTRIEIVVKSVSSDEGSEEKEGTQNGQESKEYKLEEDKGIDIQIMEMLAYTDGNEWSCSYCNFEGNHGKIRYSQEGEWSEWIIVGQNGKVHIDNVADNVSLIQWRTPWGESNEKNIEKDTAKIIFFDQYEFYSMTVDILKSLYEKLDSDEIFRNAHISVKYVDELVRIDGELDEERTDIIDKKLNIRVGKKIKFKCSVDKEEKGIFYAKYFDKLEKTVKWCETKNSFDEETFLLMEIDFNGNQLQEG